MSLPFLGKYKADIRALSLLKAGDFKPPFSKDPWGAAQVSHNVREMGEGVAVWKDPEHRPFPPI